MKPLALPSAAALALLLAACNQNADNSGSTGTVTADQIPANQGMGGANDGAPGASEPAASQSTGAPAENPAGAQGYPATGRP